MPDPDARSAADFDSAFGSPFGSPFGDDDGDADAAAALYELAAPDLPPPTSVRREATADPEVSAWAVHAKGGVLRMKVAGAEPAAERLRRGALLLPSLAGEGLRVPEPVRVVEKPGGASVTVALERRLGTTNGTVGWPILGAPGRLALAEAFARALLALHAVPAARGGGSRASPAAAPDRSLATAGPPPGPSSCPWRDLIERRVRERIAGLRDADVLARDSGARIEAKLLAAAARLPDRIEPSLCHGGLSLSAVALERRAFAGLHDFESACRADRWLDVAAAVSALGGPGTGPARRFLEVYGAGVPPPADLASRLELYGGLVLLRSLSVVAAAFPVEARVAAERLTDHLSGRLVDASPDGTIETL